MTEIITSVFIHQSHLPRLNLIAEANQTSIAAEMACAWTAFLDAHRDDITAQREDPIPTTWQNDIPRDGFVHRAVSIDLQHDRDLDLLVHRYGRSRKSLMDEAFEAHIQSEMYDDPDQFTSRLLAAREENGAIVVRLLSHT